MARQESATGSCGASASSAAPSGPSPRPLFSCGGSEEEAKQLDAIVLASGVSSFWRKEQPSRHLHFPSLVYDTYTHASDVPFSTQMKANYSWVMTFAVAGVACRYGAGKLGTLLGIAAPSPHGVEADGSLEAVMFYDLLANTAGSFVMGACVGASPWIIPRFPAIYAGLTTGFCGCFTTFSSWNNAAASILLRGQVARTVACLVVGFATASGALTLGAQASSKAARQKSGPACSGSRSHASLQKLTRLPARGSPLGPRGAKPSQAVPRVSCLPP